MTLAEEDEPPRAAPEGYPQVLPFVLAVAMHALVIGAGVIHYPEAEPVEAPESIPVEIVQLPKEEPEPESQPEPEPEPQAEPEQRPETMMLTARSSGASDNPDLEAHEAPRAEVEAEPKVLKPVEDATDSPELSSDLTFGLSSYDEIMETMDTTAFNIPAGSKKNSGPGQGGGDPYLNAMRDRINARIVYPGARGRAGTAAYRAIVTREGRLARVELVRSTGVDALDQAGLDAIRASAPFSPLPVYIPGDSAVIDIALRIAP